MSPRAARERGLDHWLAAGLGLVIAGTAVCVLFRVPVQQTQYAAIPIGLLILALIIRDGRGNRRDEP